VRGFATKYTKVRKDELHRGGAEFAEVRKSFYDKTSDSDRVSAFLR